jgi:hypothetical protein
MTYAELLAELSSRKALIVHCSRPGKGDEGKDVVLFPQDMIDAVMLCDTGKTELCCSVIWPGHVETFGDLGILLKPRSTEAVTMICTIDGGTSVDPSTGRRVGAGVPFSDQAVAETFASPTNYNEWNIDDADTIGVFVSSRRQLPQVAALQDITKIAGYDPVMGTEPLIGHRWVEFSEIAAVFPDLPVFTIENGEIVDLTGASVSPYT